MKILLSSLLVLALAAPVFAQPGFQGPGAGQGGGFQGPTAGIQADTVAKALKCWDDAPVILTGNIVQRYAGSDDKYLFKDATGEIIVEIDFGVFAGRTVTPETRVRLSGILEMDGLLDPAMVEVKVVEILT